MIDRTSKEKEISIKEVKIDKNLRRANVELENLRKQKTEGNSNEKIIKLENNLIDYISWLQKELEELKKKYKDQ